MKKKIKLKLKRATEEIEDSWEDLAQPTSDESLVYAWEQPTDSELPITPPKKKFRLKKKKGRGQQRLIQVTLGYDDHGIDQSAMLMEVVASRDTIPSDWTLERWSEYLHNVGNVPFYILQRDIDRYHLCIYAAEVLRNQSHDVRASGIHALRQDKNFDMFKHQPEIDGVTWGGLDDGEVEGDYGLSHTRPAPIREQVEESKKTLIESNKANVVPAPVHSGEEAIILRWQQAEKIARNMPRAQWEGHVDFEFEQMVKYCYGWLRDISEVPQPYPAETIDLFWPRPKSLDQGEHAVKRRNHLVGKVMSFWRKSVKQNGEGMDLSSQSYRVVLAAKELEKAIEAYATSAFPSEEMELKVKTQAKLYFQAHFPVALSGAKPGPISTSDPDYVEYLRLCRKYKLEEGALLHEMGL